MHDSILGERPMKDYRLMNAITVKVSSNGRYCARTHNLMRFYTPAHLEPFEQAIYSAANKVIKELGWVDTYYNPGVMPDGSVVFVAVGHVIESVRVHLFRYYDKTYGNTYFSSRTVVKFRNGRTIKFYCPPEYSNEYSAQVEALKCLKSFDFPIGAITPSEVETLYGIVYSYDVTQRSRLNDLYLGPGHG